jgi:hypothetical protein
MKIGEVSIDFVKTLHRAIKGVAVQSRRKSDLLFVLHCSDEEAGKPVEDLVHVTHLHAIIPGSKAGCEAKIFSATGSRSSCTRVHPPDFTATFKAFRIAAASASG